MVPFKFSCFQCRRLNRQQGVLGTLPTGHNDHYHHWIVRLDQTASKRRSTFQLENLQLFNGQWWPPLKGSRKQRCKQCSIVTAWERKTASLQPDGHFHYRRKTRECRRDDLKFSVPLKQSTAWLDFALMLVNYLIIITEPLGFATHAPVWTKQTSALMKCVLPQLPCFSIIPETPGAEWGLSKPLLSSIHQPSYKCPSV